MGADFSRIGRSNVKRSKAHERLAAKFLSEWSGITFRRRRAEGRGAAVIGIEGAADVIAVGADVNFSIEAKCGKNFSLDALLASPLTALYTEWWHQSTYDANIMSEFKKRPIYPLVFFRPSINANWIGLPVSSINTLRSKQSSDAHSSLWFPHLIYNGYSQLPTVPGNVSHSPKHKVIVDVKLDDVVFCRWHDFANNVDPKSFVLGGV